MTEIAFSLFGNVQKWTCPKWIDSKCQKWIIPWEIKKIKKGYGRMTGGTEASVPQVKQKKRGRLYAPAGDRTGVSRCGLAWSTTRLARCYW